METVGAPPAHTNGAVQSPTPLLDEELKNYKLPTNRLTKKLGEKDRGRTPLVLCACGSFSPITYCMSLLRTCGHERDRDG
jgi:hypothetical protein